MKVIETGLPGCVVIEPAVFGDERGVFFETWNAERFGQHGLPTKFVQSNVSTSVKGVLRGLHYQLQRPQGRLVRVVAGSVFDVAVDLRRSSANFGKWVGVILSAEQHQQIWIPPGFAHGFLVLSESAEFLYKTTEYYVPEYERSLLWNDPELAIAWPLELGQTPLLAAKDAAALPLAQAECYA